MISPRYQITGEIGSGGIGKVYKAVDRHAGKTVAIKVLSHPDQEHIDRFKNEFLLLRRLNHPHIVPVYDFGFSEESFPYFSMEYVEAQDWNSLLRPLDYSEFRLLIFRICGTLDFLHSKGIIHGDLKPSNILLFASPDGQLIPIFTDFGFAELGKPEESAWWKGTISYLAPEIIRGEKCTHQADLYSLGVVIYESIFGKRPFQEEELAQLARSHLEKEVIIPQEPPIPEDLRNVVLKLLEKDPMDRYFSAAEVMDELRKTSGLEAFDVDSSLAGHLIASADFVGRENQLSALKEAFSRISDDGCAVLLISGDSGIGKTRLLREFSAWAELEGALVLNPCLKEGKPIEAYQESISRLLQNRTSLRVLMVDDLEQANHSSLDLLCRLVAQAETNKLLFCLTVTNGLSRSEKDTQASEIEKTLKSKFQERVKVLRLEELAQDEVRRLSCSLFSWKEKEAQIASAVYEKTQGNPLLIRQLFECLAENRHIRRRDDGWMLALDQMDEARAPAVLAEDVTDRLSRLSGEELNILHMASALGGQFQINALSTLSGLDPKVFGEQVQNIFAERILVPSPDPHDDEQVRFSNGFTRDILYRQIGPDKAKSLHLAIAGYLEKRQTSGTEDHLDQLAEHYYRADQGEAALRYALLAAGRAADSGQAAQAITHYLRVLELWDRWSSSCTKPKTEILRNLAKQCEADGRYDEGIEYSEKALNLVKGENVEDPSIAQIYRRMARIYGKGGQHERAMNVLSQALPLLDSESQPSEYASVLIDLAWEKRLSCQYDQAISHLEKAIGVLRGGDPSKEMAIGLNRLAGVYYALGDYANALKTLSESLEAFQKLGDIEQMAGCYIAKVLLLRSKGLAGEALEDSQRALALLEKLSDPHRMSILQHNMGIIHMDLNLWNQALEYFKTGLNLRMELHDLKGVANSHNSIGHVYLRKGLFEKSLDRLTSALQLFQKTRDRSGAALVYYNLADLHRCKEEYEWASYYLEKSLKIATQIGEESRIADCLLLSGKLYEERSELPRAGEDLSRAAELFAVGGNRLGEAETHLAQAELSVGMQNLAQAEEHLDGVRPFVESSGNRWLEAIYDRVWADLRESKGDLSGCLEQLLHAAAIFKSLGARYELGKIHLKLGKLKLQTGRVKEARAFLKEALSVFDKLGVEGGRKEAKTVLEQVKETSHLERERVRTFYRLADMLNSVWDADELLTKSLELVIDLLNAERGAIILYSEKDKSFEVKVSRGLEPETSKDAVAVSRRVLTDVIRSDSPLIVDDASNNPQFAASKSVVLYNILSILCVPLRTKSRLIGTVYLDHRSLPAVFSSEDVDFLKAFASLIATAIEKGELYVKAHEEMFQLKETLHQYYEYPHIVGKSAKMQEIFNLVEKVADSKTSVLVLGEGGTGKELIAHLIHERSQRRDGPFIRVNCAALAETMLESELFGIEEKAATGVAFRKGKFELADRGTIFLDEIGDMSLSLQAKVLRVLQEKEFERVGGQKSIKVDIRIVSATNQDLQKKVQDGSFRTDLFYRLNPIVITIPPLRDRKDDIPLLVRYFTQKYAEENKKPQVKITSKVMSAILGHAWEGSNVRELQHFIEKATLLSENADFPQHLLYELNAKQQYRDIDGPSKLKDLLDWVEKKRIVQALDAYRWNQVRAAKELGLNETTLRRRMKKHRITKPARIQSS